MSPLQGTNDTYSDKVAVPDDRGGRRAARRQEVLDVPFEVIDAYEIMCALVRDVAVLDERGVCAVIVDRLAEGHMILGEMHVAGVP